MMMMAILLLLLLLMFAIMEEWVSDYGRTCEVVRCCGSCMIFCRMRYGESVMCMHVKG